MAKRVIISKAGVFTTLEEAAEHFGVTVATVCRAMKDGKMLDGIELKYAERVFAIRLVSGEWTVAMRDSRNYSYVKLDQSIRKVSRKDVDMEIDITLGWYFGERKEWHNI